MSSDTSKNTSPAPTRRVPTYQGTPGKLGIPRKHVTVKETTMPGQKKGS